LIARFGVGYFAAGFSINDFKWRHFRGEVILSAVRWYCKMVSYRNLEMCCVNAVSMSTTTISRWVQHYAPEMEKRLRCYCKRPSMWRSGRVDEIM
jgi:transposase, IS6 family